MKPDGRTACGRRAGGDRGCALLHPTSNRAPVNKQGWMAVGAVSAAECRSLPPTSAEERGGAGC
jgi:hypothetical protein